MISRQNSELLARKMRRPPPTDDPSLKITINMGGLCKLLDEARAEGMAAAMAAGVSSRNTQAENVEAVLKRAADHLREGR